MSNTVPKKFLHLLNKVNREEFENLCKDNSCQEIANLYGVHQGLIIKLLKYWGISKNRSYRKCNSIKNIEKKHQNLQEEDFRIYYISHSIDKTREHFNLTRFELEYFKNKFNIVKTKEDFKNTRNLSILEMCDGNLQEYYQDVNTKRINTFINNYGSEENAYKTRHENAKTTLLNKYGCDNSRHIEGVGEKIKEKWENKTKEELEELWGKKLKTILENWGGDLNEYWEDIHEKAKVTIAQDPQFYNKRLEKYKETSLKKYGVDNYNKLEECTQARFETYSKNYGSVENFYSSRNEKIYNTKKENNSFNISKPEMLFYEFLCQKYGKNNVEHHYKDERYSREDGYQYECDFYLKQFDLFIEYNGAWQHGPKPFDPKDEECIKLLEQWKNKGKSSDNYKSAIITWIISDVDKVKIALKNCLNYLVIYGDDIYKYLKGELKIPEIKN